MTELLPIVLVFRGFSIVKLLNYCCKASMPECPSRDHSQFLIPHYKKDMYFCPLLSFLFTDNFNRTFCM